MVATSKGKGTTFTSADTTTPKDITATAGSNGTKIISISGVSDDTAAINVKLYAHDGSTAFWVGTMRVPIASGSDGAVASTSLLNHTAFPWLEDDRGFVLPSGWKLQAGCLATMTAAKTLTLNVLSGDY